MRRTYLIGAGILIVIGLINCFANIMAVGQYQFFFNAYNGAMFFPSVFMMALGMMAGFLLGLSWLTKDKTNALEGDGGYDYEI